MTAEIPQEGAAKEAASFIHLRVRTALSLLQSMIRPKDLAKWAAATGAPAVAVTDENLFAALELAEALGRSKAQMTAIIDALEARGWVRRERHATDRRFISVYLTDDGRDVLVSEEDDELIRAADFPADRKPRVMVG